METGLFPVPVRGGARKMPGPGQWIAGESIVQRMDPRVKIASTVALSLFTFRAGWADACLISLLLLAVMRAARLEFARMLLVVRPLAWFAGLFFLLHLFFTDGTALWSLPALHIRITREGLFQGALVAWQFAALVLCGAVLSMTTTPSDLIGGLEKLLSPLKHLKVPTQELAVMAAMALRFVPAMRDEFDRIQTAQAARGADLEGGGLWGRAKAALSVAIPLMISAFRRADELAEAMEARGYHRGPRTALRELRLDGKDFAAMGFMMIFMAVLAISRVHMKP